MRKSDKFRVNDIVRMINYKGDKLDQGTVKGVCEDDTEENRVYIKWDDDVEGIVATTEDVNRLFNVSHYNREHSLMNKYQQNYEKLKLYLEEKYELDMIKLSYLFRGSNYNKNNLFESDDFDERNIGDKIIEEYNEKIMSQLIKKVK